MPTLTKLRISLKTGSEPFSGTNARIYLALAGRNFRRIYRLPTNADNLEAGQLDIFVAECPDGPDLDDLHSVLLINGMDGRLLRK